MQPAPAGVLLFPIGRFLAGQHTQLETGAPRADRHVHVGARRITVDRREGAGRAQVALILGIQVEPALVVAEVAALDAKRAAHEAVGAIGADDVAHAEFTGRVRPLRVLAAAPGMGGQRHALLVLLQRVDFPAAQHGHVRVALGARLDGILDVGLVDRDVRGIAAGPPAPVQFQQQIAGRVAIVIGVDRLGAAQRPLDLAAGLHDARGLAIDMREPGQAIRRGPALDDHHAIARASQHRSRDQAGGPVSDHRHVVARGLVRAMRLLF